MNFGENEKQILKFWEENKIFEKLRKKNKGKAPWSFLDGPITANNPMGAHHGWGRTYKDMFQRYKAMRGFDLRWQNGFDCQGLWVEVGVEKDLGFKNKQDIEEYGIAKFVQRCKERVLKYAKIQTEESIRLGQWADWDHSYFTMSDENNYAIWHFLKKCHEQGLLYKGRDSVPWCPRCGTSISQHEILTEEYKEIKHESIFFRLPVVGKPNTYFLVWTTTPWTLPGNVALAVNPNLDYASVRDTKGDTYILLRGKANLVGGEVKDTFSGKELAGMEYEGMFDDLPAVSKELRSLETKSSAPFKYKVILWKDISEEEGTGIVHIAPGCGQEDFQLSKENNLPVIDLSDNESNYREGFGFLSGKFVASKEVRAWIFDNLKNQKNVFKIEEYSHRYPTCWRCKSELIFRVVDEWYIAMSKPLQNLKLKTKNEKLRLKVKNFNTEKTLRDELIDVVKQINWIPSFCLERELDWLNNMQDWLISKKRYWGLALPIFECACSDFEVIGSKEELKERAVSGWDEFEGNSPHRPWVDNVKIKCSKCGKIIERIKDVGTPWLDAGIVPFSTISEDNRATDIPYFYNNKAEWQKWFPIDFICESFPGQFKNWFYVLLVMSQVLEQKPPFKTLLGYGTVVDENGEEMHKSKGNAIWFDDAVEKISADVMRWMYATQNPSSNMRFGYNVAKETHSKLLTLWNCFAFFETYDDKSKVRSQKLEVRSQKAKVEIKDLGILERWILSRFNKLIREATEALDNYEPQKAAQAIESFWTNDLSLWYIRRSRKRFEEAQNTLYDILMNLSKLTAPILPFFSESVYGKLRTEKDSQSVHLCDWPSYDEKLINEELEKDMAQTRELVSLGLAERARVGLAVRQPLQKLKVRSEKLKVKEEIIILIQEELNVKEIVFDSSIANEVEFDTTITEDLKEEGLVREIIRHIQALRKKANLSPKDEGAIYFAAPFDLREVIFRNTKEILRTTRSSSLEESPEKLGNFLSQKEVAVEGKKLWFGIEKIS